MLIRLLKTVYVIAAFETLMIISLMILHCWGESRFIVNNGMWPTIKSGDRVFFEKVSKWRHSMLERGAIICFYPPACAFSGRTELSDDIPHVLGRLTGLSVFPFESAYDKRIIGLPGDRIRIEPDEGVFINDKLLNEPYVEEPASYKLNRLSEIGGINAQGKLTNPYANQNEPIVVPQGMLFVLGDLRNSSSDSHVWGFLSQERVISRAWFSFSQLRYLHNQGLAEPEPPAKNQLSSP